MGCLHRVIGFRGIPRRDASAAARSDAIATQAKQQRDASALLELVQSSSQAEQHEKCVLRPAMFCVQLVLESV